MNLSTPRPDPSTALRTSGRGLLEVHPEPGLSSPPSRAGLCAAEWVNLLTPPLDACLQVGSGKGGAGMSNLSVKVRI